MARKPTPCGQRIQPLFARSENVEKKTVKMIIIIIRAIEGGTSVEDDIKP